MKYLRRVLGLATEVEIEIDSFLSSPKVDYFSISRVYALCKTIIILSSKDLNCPLFMLRQPCLVLI